MAHSVAFSSGCAAPKTTESMTPFISFDYLSPAVITSPTGRNFPEFCGAALQYADGYLTPLPAGDIFTQEYTGRSFSSVFFASNLETRHTIRIHYNMASIQLTALYSGKMQVTRAGRKIAEIAGRQLYMNYSGVGTLGVTVMPGKCRLLCIAMNKEWFGQAGTDFPAFAPLLGMLQEGLPAFEKMPSTLIPENTRGLLCKYLSGKAEIPSLRDAKLENYFHKIAKAYHDRVFLEHPNVFSVYEYIHSHYIHPQLSSLNALASHFDLIPHSLNRIYRQAFGTSVRREVTRLRMRHARLLIAKEGTKVGNAGAIVGYPDVHTFSHSFKKHYGYPPSDAKKHPDELL